MGLEQVGSCRYRCACCACACTAFAHIHSCCAQTAESTPLPAYSWPRRSVLVLGREKEGLPPEIISMLDAAVEIPQLGVIRSLNVHVSGAIAMYEYAKQHAVDAAAAAAGGGST